MVGFMGCIIGLLEISFLENGLFNVSNSEYVFNLKRPFRGSHECWIQLGIWLSVQARILIIVNRHSKLVSCSLTENIFKSI